MIFIPHQTFVRESGTAPEEASARLQQILAAPKPACECCGSILLPATINWYCAKCGHDSPGKFRLEGTVSPEKFSVSLNRVTYASWFSGGLPRCGFRGASRPRPAGRGFP